MRYAAGRGLAGGMRASLLLGALACTAGETRPIVPRTPPSSPRLAIGLVGDWVRFAPTNLRGDTLTLRADSTAAGVIPWGDGRYARIARWKIMFTSRDAVVARADWAQGHADGGDPECSFGGSAACISGPQLCFGAGKQYRCETFNYTPDSLTLVDGSRFIRLSRTPATAREAGGVRLGLGRNSRIRE